MPDDPPEPEHPSSDDDPTLRAPTPEEGTAPDASNARTVADDGKRPAPAASPAAGKCTEVIGRYKLIRELGMGGFGMVWQAEQTEPIRREVALKIIKPGMDSREVLARFEAERQALALMDHPNIAAVLDAGTTDNGRPYFVMELVKGVPVTEYCDAHKLGIRERLELFIPVCQAVQHAHQKAILHRDLKPSNILVTEVDGKPVPKVIDFGIAKALAVTQEEMLRASFTLTREGMVVGTPQYMSPEQAGSMPDVDTRSDVYALGVILHELLTGQTPLSREQLRQVAFDEMLRLIREGEVKRPSSRLVPVTEAVKHLATERNTEPRKLGNALRGDLDWIMLETLEKERERRYGAANALAQDLRSYLHDEPVSAGPPSAAYRFRKMVRRNKLAFAAAAVIVTLLAGGITASTWQAVRATKAESLAKTAQQETEAKNTALKAAEKVALAKRREANEQTKRAEAAAMQVRASLSQSYFLQALRSIDERKDCDAVAQLARSLSVEPDNQAALFRLITLLTYRVYPLPLLSLRHGDHVESAQFSPDGKKIVTASYDHTAHIWDAETGKPLIEPIRHDGPVVWAEFSPDGKRFVTASYSEQAPTNGTARVWDAITGKLLVELMRDEKWAVYSAHFSPNGNQIVTVSPCGARVWDCESGKLLTALPQDEGANST